MFFWSWICSTGQRFPSGSSFFAWRWRLASVLCALAMAYAFPSGIEIHSSWRCVILWSKDAADEYVSFRPPGQMMLTHPRNLLTVTTRSILLVTFAMLIGQTIHVWPNGASANFTAKMRARTLLGASGLERIVIGTAEIGMATEKDDPRVLSMQLKLGASDFRWFYWCLGFSRVNPLGRLNPNSKQLQSTVKKWLICRGSTAIRLVRKTEHWNSM